MPKYIYVICRLGGPYWEKLCPRSVTDQPGSANNVFIFCSLENYFIRNICVEFILKQFHTVRVRLTFRSSKERSKKRRDSVFADFRTDQ